MDYILIDNFLDNVDSVRSYALNLKYFASNDKTGWKGYRIAINDDTIKSNIESKLISINSKFSELNFEMYFHYSLDSTKQTVKNFSEYRIHKDNSEWAGVIYLTPNPKENSGTTIHSDDGTILHTIDNKYNRFIFYRGDIPHGVLDTFGNSIEDGRLTITIFGYKKQKLNTTII